MSSQPAAADGSLLRVQESEDGTSFVLEFTLDANDAEAEQLVQSGYQILAGNAPENDQLAARFQSGDVSTALWNFLVSACCCAACHLVWLAASSAGASALHSSCCELRACCGHC